MAFLRSLVRSAGFRFALLYTLTFIGSVGAIGWIVAAAIDEGLREQARERVDNEAAALVDEFAHGGRIDLDAALTGRFARGAVRQSYAIVEPDGRVVTGDPKLAGLRSLGSVPARPVSRIGDVPLDRPAIAAVHGLADGTTLIVADDLDSIDDIKSVVGRAFASALIAAGALGLGLGIVLAWRLLRRVDAVTRTAEAIIAGDLGRRITVRGSGDDIDRLALAFNRMLDRISGLLENVRQVSNDIAHDLRTPLTRLRQGLQAATRETATIADYRGAVEHALGEIDEILAIFAALLRIAQIEAGARRSAFRPIDLSEVLQTIGDAYGPAIEDSGRRLGCTIEPGIVIEGDRELLLQLFANLVENAIYHTPRGTAVTMALRLSGSNAVASVADDGPGVPAADRDKVVRRFYRSDKSRGTAGHGLGLTLVSAVAELHQAPMTIADGNPGLRVSLMFPVAPPKP